MPLSLNRLNPNQKAAVLHSEGPLLILAGAGSGKTSTMSYRIAHLVADRHVPASAILGLSFTNKAAKELRERVAKLIRESAGRKAAKGLTVSTFHSLCARILRAHGDKLGFTPTFSIVDQSDQRDILKNIFRNLNIDDRKFDHDLILFEFSHAKGQLLSKEALKTYFLESGRLQHPYDVAAAEAFPRYQDQLKILNSMDFDDLQYHVVTLLSEFAEVREHYNAKFRHILVDEYQDTNPTQFRILKLLTERYQNICVVGDDDQSIYSWRGADSTHILEFAHKYPGAQTIILDQNYRSTARILEAANAVIGNNKKRHAKTLWSDRGEGEPLTEVIVNDDQEEGEFVAEEIERRAREQTRPWRDFAILYRSNTQARIFEEALRRHRVPYKIVGGQSFLERKEIKNTLCYWRLALNPDDDASFRRIFSWPARGLGRSAVEKLSDHAFANKISIFKALEAAPTLIPRSAAGAKAFRDAVLAIRQEIDTLADPSPESVANWGRRSLEKVGIRQAIEEEAEDPVQALRRWENVEELVNALGQTKLDDIAGLSAPPVTTEPVVPTTPVEVSTESTAPEAPLELTAPEPETEPVPTGGGPRAIDVLQEFLSRMSLDAQDQEKDDDSEKNEVTLLTLHGAKGLEYPVVFLVGMEDGFLPHRRTIDGQEDLSEERRLAYVGITRARDHLLMTRAKARVRYGKPVPRIRSRFADEIPKDLIVLNDRSFPDETSTKEQHDAHEARVLDHLARIREMLGKKQPQSSP